MRALLAVCLLAACSALSISRFSEDNCKKEEYNGKTVRQIWSPVFGLDPGWRGELVDDIIIPTPGKTPDERHALAVEWLQNCLNIDEKTFKSQHDSSKTWKAVHTSTASVLAQSSQDKLDSAQEHTQEHIEAQVTALLHTKNVCKRYKEAANDLAHIDPNKLPAKQAKTAAEYKKLQDDAFQLHKDCLGKTPESEIANHPSIREKIAQTANSGKKVVSKFTVQTKKRISCKKDEVKNKAKGIFMKAWTKTGWLNMKPVSKVTCAESKSAHAGSTTFTLEMPVQDDDLFDDEFQGKLIENSTDFSAIFDEDFLKEFPDSGGSSGSFQTLIYNEPTSSLKGDPHGQNMKGEAFDIMQGGAHDLVKIPH